MINNVVMDYYSQKYKYNFLMSYVGQILGQYYVSKNDDNIYNHHSVYIWYNLWEVRNL